jgi:hypothetical protein
VQKIRKIGGNDNPFFFVKTDTYEICGHPVNEVSKNAAAPAPAAGDPKTCGNRSLDRLYAVRGAKLAGLE